MPQVSLVGTGGDYTDLASWESNEQNSDYGVGNPAIAEITGSLVKENITGTWVRGYIIRAATGEGFYDGSGTAELTGGDIIISGDTSGTVCAVENLKIPGIEFGFSSSVPTYTYDKCWIAGSGSNAPLVELSSKTVTVSDSLLTGFARGTDADSASSSRAFVRCTAVDAASGNYCFVRAHTTDCFAYGGSGTGYVVPATGSDYNASDDTSSPGANSLDNRTTADFTNYAGGDYRTASGSALATAGSTGGVIGYLLEAGSGLSVTLPTIDSTNLFDVTSVEAQPAVSLTQIDSSNVFDVTQVVRQEVILLDPVDSVNDLPSMTLSLPQLVTLTEIDSVNLFHIFAILGGVPTGKGGFRSSFLGSSLLDDSIFKTDGVSD